MSTGMTPARVPVGVNPRRPAPLPSWKTQTMAPNMADRLSRFSTRALSGTTMLPNIMNSSTKVTTAMMATATGRSPRSDAVESTSWADCPPTVTSSKGASTARTSRTKRSPSADSGSTAGTTWR
jgi:hypothetical protein